MSTSPTHDDDDDDNIIISLPQSHNHRQLLPCRYHSCCQQKASRSRCSFVIASWAVKLSVYLVLHTPTTYIHSEGQVTASQLFMIALFAALCCVVANVPRAHAFSLIQSNVVQIPESNPSANTTAVSPLSGVRYSQVMEGLELIYPPSQLDARNAESRRDGYWPYINEGKDPPACFTYGEFDFYFFAQLLDKAHQFWIDDVTDTPEKHPDWTNKVFCDIGSGAGRLVVAAAALHPTLKLSRGIELLPSMNNVAKETLERHRQFDDQEDPLEENSVEEGKVSFRLPTGKDQYLPLAPVEFVCGSFSDPYVYFGDANIIFMFSSALDPELLTELSVAIGRQCHPGTIVISTDYQLDLVGTVPPVPGDDRLSTEHAFRFELVEQVDGYCWCTGGEATAYIHRLVESWGISHPLERPVPTVEDICFDVAMQRENGELTDTARFLIGVTNNVRFHRLPEAFVPRSYR